MFCIVIEFSYLRYSRSGNLKKSPTEKFCTCTLNNIYTYIVFFIIIILN